MENFNKYIKNLIWPGIAYRIRLNTIKYLTIELLTINKESNFKWNMLHNLEYKACKELVKEGKLIEIKHWYSLKTIKDVRKEKLKKINNGTV